VIKKFEKTKNIQLFFNYFTIIIILFVMSDQSKEDEVFFEITRLFEKKFIQLAAINST
jgi:hypothetical protein